ncbi:outer envelope protein 64, chloroplastic isoform X1 [Gossypium australe]|uniref:Outer envelope protein 64, chloroplastic isoform X1 n=1 Tax=Gossypium australe TaxID=47621 RepID=A0A5B6W337_9ROSI|nr:outer envelope protein 64, chloroplastic isoform X1 [Gossypium australe]
MASHAANLWVLLGLGLAGIFLMTKRLKKTIKADFGAFIQKLELLPPPQPAPPKAPHPLTGLKFAVSDVFDIEGFVTGFGHPDWLRTHEPSTRTSPVVLALVEGGATCIGKTVVDELAYRYLPLQTVFLRSRLWVFNNVLELTGMDGEEGKGGGELEGMITC